MHTDVLEDNHEDERLQRVRLTGGVRVCLRSDLEKAVAPLWGTQETAACSPGLPVLCLTEFVAACAVWHTERRTPYPLLWKKALCGGNDSEILTSSHPHSLFSEPFQFF
eukprot:TRINITY_DN26015_c0_g1_i1.p2 TRINITY_DN26015_c0_g1~~TRINITY_DN26015_c0_g1_i1.p2  ORF type:complete len:109 (+),score=0.87 TRINITY_DN26015_c0_g1_i1:790-1116(+)